MRTNIKPKNKPVAIQGEIGSYSHIAVNSTFGKDQFINFHKSFDAVFEDLESGNVDYVVVPIENSTYGSIYQNYDNITKFNTLIIDEVYLKINFHLIVNKGAELKNLKKIYSHPVGLGQIREFVKDKKIEPIEYPDTAGAVQMIKDQDLKDSAAAASRFAAEIYDMQVIAEDIHENPKNYTRFFVLCSTEEAREKYLEQKKYPTNSNFKTTIQFSLGEEPGSLYKSLRCFADRDIALSKIESRPIINTDWEYRFYVDLEAAADSDKVQNAFRELSDYVKNFDVLGSYKRGEYIET